MNLLHKAKQNQEASMLEVTKSGIKLSADTAMLIGQTNFEILNYRRTKIMPELNYSYRQLSFNQGDHQNYSLEKIYQSKSKKYLKLTKWGLQFQESHSLLVVLYQLPLINPHKIKSSLPFCTGPEGIKKKTSVHGESVGTVPSKLQETAEPMVPIRQQELQLKTKAEMPTHCNHR